MIYLVSLFAAIAFLTIIFIWCVVEDNLGLIDVAWGLTGLASGLSVQFYFGVHHDLMILTNFAVGLWAIRLSGYLFIRNHGKPEDARYTKMREGWSGNIYFNAYYRVFLLQAVLMSINILPVIYVASVKAPVELNGVNYIGFALFLLGFIYEAWADFGLYQFKKDPQNKGKLYTKGAWKYSQHPNYFGEVFLWWGIYVMVCMHVPIWTILGPIAITFLILKVSGIPMKINRSKDKPEYKEYLEKTNLFFPWCS